MVRSWYLSTSQDRRVQQDVDTATLCARTGMEVWYFHHDQLHAKPENPSLVKLKRARGCQYEDEVHMRPSMSNYEDALRICSLEHVHTQEEIRLILEGSGFFDVRDGDGNWLRLHVFAGDLIILPAGIHHRFTLDNQNYIRARRYFLEKPTRAATKPCGVDSHGSENVWLDTSDVLC